MAHNGLDSVQERVQFGSEFRLDLVFIINWICVIGAQLSSAKDRHTVVWRFNLVSDVLDFISKGLNSGLKTPDWTRKCGSLFRRGWIQSRKDWSLFRRG